ncbi:UvrD-helicase domain-containing protein [Brachybacterium alimentarium]|uniref:UvrD-helicase domain-containing protein n=1 Tax=Brachybacterium alimentarium TaxID=47845 RepID=UPI003FD3FE70
MSDGTISISDTFMSSIPRELLTQVDSALKKLRSNRELKGLHVEPIHQAADDRIRSIRINRQFRILAFELSKGRPYWLVEGVYDHDDAYRVARTLYLRVNPVSGTTEIRSDAESHNLGGEGISESEVQRRAAELAARQIAEREAREAEQRAREEERAAADEAEKASAEDRAAPASAVPKGPVLTVSAGLLETELGIDHDLAVRAAEADEDALLDLAAGAPRWQGQALIDLATGTPFPDVRDAYFTGAGGGSDIGTPSPTDDLVRSMDSGASRASFHLIEDDEALEKVLASGDFANWRIFLHPEQRKYVDVNTQGPYRLTGGAGTGKTVVLVHRAVRLARKAQAEGREPRIVLTTYTRNLADALETQVRSLDNAIDRASVLGRGGVYIDNVDRIARNLVIGRADAVSPMESVLGWSSRRLGNIRPVADWRTAVAEAGDPLDENLRSETFFADEYREVILPLRITDEASYLRVSRRGRGTRLGRIQRRDVWKVVSRYRENGMRDEQIDWDELSAIAAAVLDARAAEAGERPADHVLVDEGQDLRPPQWQMLRALVADGKDDMFIAEDSHQRIYSNPVRLGRYGIRITGRSRRLKLNYRTTAQNLAFAVGILDGGQFDLATMDEETISSTEQGAFRSARSGPAPRLVHAEEMVDEFETVASQVRAWLDELDETGTDPSAIGLLTRWGRSRDMLVRAMDDRGITVANIDRNPERAGYPIAMTFNRAKGMEFSKVLLFGVDEDSVRRLRPEQAYDEQATEIAELQERSLLYVGASRARDELVITWSRGASPYLQIDEESDDRIGEGRTAS